MQKVKLKSESGRSMVEMLGVLAIIGVLSVGGIAGYKMAMERHELNELVNEINLATHEVNTFMELNPGKGQNFTFKRGNAKISIALVEGGWCANNVCFHYSLDVQGISKGVCQAIRDKKVSFDYLNPVGWYFSNGAPQPYGTTDGVGDCSEHNEQSWITFLF